MNREKYVLFLSLILFITFISCTGISSKLGSKEPFVVVVEDTTGEQYLWAREFFDSLGYTAKFVENSNLSQCIEGIKKGDYNLLAKKIIITSDLRKELAFTTNLSVDKQVLVQRECGDTTCFYVDDLLKMEGKSIYVTSASPSVMRLENIKHEIGADFEIVETPHTRCDYLLEMVSNGQIDYVACDYETASDKLEKFSNLDIKTEISFTQFKAWAINKDSVYLLQQLDSFLQKKVTMHAIDGLNKK